MAAQLQELRARLRPVDSTRKTTRAQELIAASRIGRAQARVAAATPYYREITGVLSALAAASALLLAVPASPRRNPVVVMEKRHTANARALSSRCGAAQGITLSWLLTWVTPGAEKAAYSTWRRSAQEDTVPLRLTTLPSSATVTRWASTARDAPTPR